MIRFFGVVVLAIFCRIFVDGSEDLTPEAITVYRNPEFFKNLNYDAKTNYNQKSAKVSEVGTHAGYKTPGDSKKSKISSSPRFDVDYDNSPADYQYPGETKKPNPPASPGFEINYDNSPEFHHEPREIFINPTYKPPKKKGPYSRIYNSERSNKANIQKPVQEKPSEEEESKESKENFESGEEPRDFVSVFNENPEEEFKSYHEPILLARPSFDPSRSSGFASSSYTKPYQYNRTRPILYEDWKLQTYPKIHANKHLKSDSRLYSEEPSSNYFEDESSSYYGQDDDNEDVSNFFESDESKNQGADTKHIYKKLLKPKKSFLFKFHSKPKFKKLKLKLKKKHLHNTDWFDEYPFDF